MYLTDSARLHWRRHPLKLLTGIAITLAGMIAATGLV
jgi:hypothetical protein